MTLPTLPTLEELLHPERQPGPIREKAHASTDPLDPVNLFNISWRDKNGKVPHVVLPKALTGVDANIVVMSAKHFPSGSHKVGPAFSCLREAILDRKITPEGVKLVFPSTGNYGIGGAWVGPRVGFRSLVVLPEEMSAERFAKIKAYGAEVIATPGCESNVKEIYDKVGELRADKSNVILNQFEEFGNYRFHYHVTGGSARELAQELKTHDIGDGRVAAFVSAMGSAGTSAATDYLKAQFPECRGVAVEPVQCPTLFNVGYGGHAIEGIGDKHVTWIHNVRNCDLLVCIDDQHTLRGMQLLQEGKEVLKKELNLDEDFLNSIDNMFGPSGVCNILAAIKSAKHWGLEAHENVFTVATDGFDRYPSVVERLVKEEGPQTDAVARGRIELFRGADTTWIQDGTPDNRRRWHNQKYFTWVEQQGKSVEELNALWDLSYWRDQAALIPEYDNRILKLR